MKTQKGFTLIELVMIIVILGILAATAIPQFINLQTEAGAAAAQGVAGALASGAAINYATSQTTNAGKVTVSDCATTAATLQGGLPAGYTVTGAGPTGCVVTRTVGGYTANFNTIFAS